MLVQTLIPLDQAPHQESPTPPKRRKTRLILRPAIAVSRAQRPTQREPKRTHQVPEADMPTQDPERREIPRGLRLEHEQHARDDEAGAADDLRGPEDAVEGALGEAVVDAGQGGEAGDPEDGGAEELCEGGEEAEFVEVVRAEGGEGGEPDPGAGGRGAACVGVRGLAGVDAVEGGGGEGEGGGKDWLSLVWDGRRKEIQGVVEVVLCLRMGTRLGG